MKKVQVLGYSLILVVLALSSTTWRLRAQERTILEDVATDVISEMLSHSLLSLIWIPDEIDFYGGVTTSTSPVALVGIRPHWRFGEGGPLSLVAEGTLALHEDRGYRQLGLHLFWQFKPLGERRVVAPYIGLGGAINFYETMGSFSEEWAVAATAGVRFSSILGGGLYIEYAHRSFHLPGTIRAGYRIRF